MSFFDTTAEDAAQIVAEVGRDVIFRGVVVKCMVSPAPLSLDLAQGGFVETGSIQVRFLRSDYSGAPPSDGEQLTFAGKTYRINSIAPVTVGAWYTVNANTLAS